MTAFPVEWVLVVFYGPSAHRATYGRLAGTYYTKDFIQLKRTPDFVSDLNTLFPPNSAGVAPITYRWSGGEARGQIVFNSADRPHLSWETRAGAPAAWKMILAPTATTPQTIPGDPSQSDERKADQELSLISRRGGGQPYLIAVKLHGEANTLHVRSYLKTSDPKYSWANVSLLPKEIRELAEKTSRNRTLAWSMIGDTLLFDPDRNHDAWPSAAPSAGGVASATGAAPGSISSPHLEVPQSDLAAETLEVSAEEVAAFSKQIEDKNYAVTDSFGTAKTRGSAQRAFAERVKANYGMRCAVSGISTKDFLVASHIVPWSKDHSIRLDPSNGICLSLLIDRAFENGFLVVADDLSVAIDWRRVGTDTALQLLLKPYDGMKLRPPSSQPPKPDYLRRRRQLLS